MKEGGGWSCCKHTVFGSDVIAILALGQNPAGEGSFARGQFFPGLLPGLIPAPDLQKFAQKRESKNIIRDLRTPAELPLVGLIVARDGELLHQGVGRVAQGSWPDPDGMRGILYRDGLEFDLPDGSAG